VSIQLSITYKSLIQMLFPERASQKNKSQIKIILPGRTYF